MIRQATSPADIDAVRALCWAYRDYLSNFSTEMRRTTSLAYTKAAFPALMQSLDVKHARPKGLILIAEVDAQPIGCGMYSAIGESDAEIKRVFVKDTARRTGAGIQISQALLDSAKADGYHRVLLDTSRQFDAAQSLYEKLGFKQRGPYSDLSPELSELLVFYELTL